ncbi:MAG TPA: PAS domain S-box protein, partial [Pirellulales bacterium]
MSGEPAERIRDGVIAYSAAALLVGATAVLRGLLDPVLHEEHPFMLFLFPVVGAASLSGWRVGLFALALGGLAGAYFFLEPRYSPLIVHPANQAGLLLYLGVGAFSVAIAESRRRLLVRSQAVAQRLGVEASAVQTAAAQDVSSRRRAEVAVADALERVRGIVEQAVDGIITIDERGIVESVNPAAERMFDYTAEELIGRNVSMLMPSPYRDEHDGYLANYLETGKAAIIGIGREVRGRRRNGEVFPLDLSVSEVQLAQGRLFTGLVRDVTERRMAEEALRLRDRAIQAVSQGILITDPNLADNPIIFASRGFEQITGYAAAEVYGRNCRFLQGAGTDRHAIATLHEAIATGRECAVEMLNYKKDGSPFWNSLSITPIREGGRVTHFVGITMDVTDRRRLETQLRQAQKMEAIGQLAGGVSHDFNNLLTVINGYSEMLLEQLPPDAPSRVAVSAILQAGERAAGLTTQLLAFSRQAVLEPRVVDPNAVVAETGKMLQRLIGEDVFLSTALAPGVSRVNVDPGQLVQVLMNLAVNARDAMPQGGKLTIETRNVELSGDEVQRRFELRSGPYVLLSVSDTGTGIADEVKSRVFEPFFTTKEQGKGTGLGLATVYGIVKQSGGSIDFY